MRPQSAVVGVAASALLLIGSVGIRALAQGGPPQTPPQTGTPPPGQGAGGQGAGAGAGGQRGRGTATFPAQQRAQADPEVIARGKGLYGTNCRSCHGVDLRGGDQGGPNLLRSEVALNDVDGESIMPVVLGSRASQGMDAIDLPEADIKAIAAYIRSVLAQGRGQGAPPPGPPVVLNVLVGDAAGGSDVLRRALLDMPFGHWRPAGYRRADDGCDAVAEFLGVRRIDRRWPRRRQPGPRCRTGSRRRRRDDALPTRGR
jgi:cytochrome c oxidase cbb3-type subunit 3